MKCNPFPSAPCLYYVSEVVSTSLLSSYCVLIQLRLHYVIFEHFQSSTISCTSIKTISHPYRFLLRSYYMYIVQVLTASIQFFKDVVGTYPSVTGFKVRNRPLVYSRHDTLVTFLLSKVKPETHIFL